MPNKNSPAKHKTPNYRLLADPPYRAKDGRLITPQGVWAALPLRADRKDRFE